MLFNLPSGHPVMPSSSKPRIPSAPPRRPRTAHEFVVQTLRADILQGRLVAGTHLRQDELAKRMGISTTPVREALRTLVSEGLLFFDAHRGAVVRGLTLGDVKEIYELRMVLELLMVEAVISIISSEDIAKAERIHDEMLRTQDVARWTELNLEFHTALTVCQEHTRLAHLIQNLRDSAAPYIALSLYMSPDHIAASNREHGEILAQYKQRDVECAKRHTLDHLDKTLKIILRAIDNSESAVT